MAFLRRLADHGQTVLCTVHQPSAILFQQFEKLLLLGMNGRPCYFGDIGPNSKTLIEYFEKNGARICGPAENPAEYILEVVGKGNSTTGQLDWPFIWNESPENAEVHKRIELICMEKPNQTTSEALDESTNHPTHEPEFALPFVDQLWWVTVRVFQQYWRSPDYIWAKMLLGTVSALSVSVKPSLAFPKKPNLF